MAVPGFQRFRDQYELADCHRHVQTEPRTAPGQSVMCCNASGGCSNPELWLWSPQVHERHCAFAGLYSAALDLAAVLSPLPQQAGPKVLGGRHLKQLLQVFRSMATDCVERQLQGQSEPQPFRQPSAGEAGSSQAAQSVCLGQVTVFGPASGSIRAHLGVACEHPPCRSLLARDVVVYSFVPTNGYRLGA